MSRFEGDTDVPGGCRMRAGGFGMRRREFIKTAAAAAAGSLVMRGGFALAQGTAGRRQISIGGKRIKVIDAHAHLSIPAVADVVKGTSYARNGNAAANQVIGPDRLKAMDALG